MQTTLSHSQLSRFQMCSHSYKLHYIDRIRPKVTHAALLFGSAMDAALNIILTEPNAGNKSEEEFEKTFTTSKINDEEVYLPTNISLVYSNSDFDGDLLTEEDYKFITKTIESSQLTQYTDYLEVYKQLGSRKKESGFDSLTDKEKSFFNLMNWTCLRQKGFLMLQAYRKKVLPRIHKVYAVQKKVSLSNNVGDSIVGYVDLIAELKGEEGVAVILDNKTSSMEYEADSVLTSPQLSLYTHILEKEYSTRKAGYIVLRKQIIKNRKKICKSCGFDGSGGRHTTCNNTIGGKRCGGEWVETISPEVAIQFIVDEIPEATEALVMENVDGINDAIKAKSFTRNLNSCSNWYGGKCAYFNLCYRNNMQGLEYIKKESR
jgi:PD-(D/E)XK nuclease superfamily